jgi:hypothetical protein
MTSHHEVWEDQLTSSSTRGELATSQSEMMPSHLHELGGQPYHSIALFMSDGISIKKELIELAHVALDHRVEVVS